jgi:hypothetical protein
MALNFTGRAKLSAEKAQPPGRTAVVVVTCFGAAAVLAGLVFAAAVRQHQPSAPLPPLVGSDRTLAAVVSPGPSASARTWSEHWSMHPAAAEAASSQVSPAQAAPPPTAQAAPRTLTPAVAKARMLAALRQVPHGTVTLSVEDDPGAQAYARKLADLFREAGWTVEENSVFGSGPPRHGMAAAFGVSPSDEAVREAFDAVGFQFESPPADAGIIRTPEIFVGRPYDAPR